MDCEINLAVWDGPDNRASVLDNLYRCDRRYFGTVGADVEIVTENIDYFALQQNIASLPEELEGLGADKSPYIQVRRNITTIVKPSEQLKIV